MNINTEFKNRNYSKVIELANESLKNKFDSRILYFRAVAYFELKDHDAATSDFKEILKHDSGNILAYYALAEIYTKQNDFKTAITYYEDLLKLTHELKAFKELAKLYFKIGNKDKALEYCYTVLEQSDDIETKNLMENIRNT